MGEILSKSSRQIVEAVGCEKSTAAGGGIKAGLGVIFVRRAFGCRRRVLGVLRGAWRCRRCKRGLAMQKIS